MLVHAAEVAGVTLLPPACKAGGKRLTEADARRVANMIVVAAGVITRGSEVLICQRRWDSPHAGKWEFPGGKLEAGESVAQALRREIREELGIEADPGIELWRTDHQYEGGPTVSIVFLRIDGFDGQIENRCFAALRWVPFDALPGYDFLEADRDFVNRLVSRGPRLAAS